MKATILTASKSKYTVENIFSPMTYSNKARRKGVTIETKVGSVYIPPASILEIKYEKE